MSFEYYWLRYTLKSTMLRRMRSISNHWSRTFTCNTLSEAMITHDKLTDKKPRNPSNKITSNHYKHSQLFKNLSQPSMLPTSKKKKDSRPKRWWRTSTSKYGTTKSSAKSKSPKTSSLITCSKKSKITPMTI